MLIGLGSDCAQKVIYERVGEEKKLGGPYEENAGEADMAIKARISAMKMLSHDLRLSWHSRVPSASGSLRDLTPAGAPARKPASDADV